MANNDSPFGLKPVRMMGGAPYSGGQSDTELQVERLHLYFKAT